MSTLRLVTNYIPLPENDLPDNIRDTQPYYINRIGGSVGLAQLYLEAGQLYLEGSASLILASSTPIALSSIRTSEPFIHPSTRETGTETWRKDREAARRFFSRAQVLDPTLEIPVLPSDNEELKNNEHQTKEGVSRPTLREKGSIEDHHELQNSPVKRLQKAKDLVDPYVESEENDMWYFYLPSVIGAVLAVGVVGVLSFSSWRKKQN